MHYNKITEKKYFFLRFKLCRHFLAALDSQTNDQFPVILSKKTTTTANINENIVHTKRMKYRYAHTNEEIGKA